MGKCYSTSAPVPAQTALLPVRIKIQHAEIQFRMPANQDESVRPDPEAPAAELTDQRWPFQGKGLVPVIDQDEIIPGTMVF
jgi:hypothetical protein